MTTTTDRRQGINSSIVAKAPVAAATTANITLSGTQTIDGVALIADDRVLVKDQTDGVENGIYDVNSSTWTRSPDFDGSYDVTERTLVKIEAGGAINGGLDYELSTTGSIVIGTTSLSFAIYPPDIIQWNPELSDGSNFASLITAIGRYSRVGNLIFFTCHLELSNLDLVSGALRIEGLPFTSRNLTNLDTAVTVGQVSGISITAGQSVGGEIPANADYILLTLWDSTTGTSGLLESEFGNSGIITVSGAYFV